MKTKDLLKLSPEEKVEVWFEKFLGFEVKKDSAPFMKRYLCKKSADDEWETLPDILDSLSKWNECVEKPMGEMEP